jgi:hypothetical protein
VSVQPPAAPGQPPLPAPGSLRCPRCSATIGPDQDWCLECGAPARTRLAQTPNWQLPTVAVGAIVLIAGALLAFAFVKLTDDDSAPVATTPTTAPATIAPAVPPEIVPTTPATTPTTVTNTPTTPAATTPSGPATTPTTTPTTTTTTATTPTTPQTSSTTPGAAPPPPLTPRTTATTP